jgi:hypothetical protein
LIIHRLHVMTVLKFRPISVSDFDDAIIQFWEEDVFVGSDI